MMLFYLLANIQAKFNEQTEPIYKLLQDTENITLSNEVLEPEPTIIPHLHPKFVVSRAYMSCFT